MRCGCARLAVFWAAIFTTAALIVTFAGAGLARASLGFTAAPAPYMGVDTWYAFGPNIDENTVVRLTDATVMRGLRAVGYRYIWLDAGWWGGARDANGNIVLDPTQWPHGMAWLTNYIHSKGLLAGIYTEVGQAACSNGGSLGHFQQDVDQFAAWGFDAVKGDFCGAYSLHLHPRAVFTSFAQAIGNDVPHRAMMLDACNADTWSAYPDTAFDDWSWGPKIAAAWRTDADLSWPGGLTWRHILRNIDDDARHPQAAGHGHWNDPDYLAPAYLSRAQARAQFTMWAILAAPMMVSADIASLPPSTIAMLTNREAIAVSQDRLGRQGTLFAHHGQIQVWVRPLAHGSKAVAILNRGPRVGSILITPRMIGLRGQRLIVRDVWKHRTSRVSVIRTTVAGDSADLLRVSR